MEKTDIAVRDQPKSFAMGDRLGNYILERRLGEGAQAEVYLARDVVLQREVAVKILHRGSDESGEPNLEGLQEARLIATLEHPNIVRVYHVGRSGGIWYMAMEHVGGGSLRSLVGQKGELDPIEALRYIRAAADALARAHAVGVIHRDIKPHNLLVSYTGDVKLVDFGLAAWDPNNLDAANGPTDKRRVGTPEYLAPEVWMNKGAGVCSDIYGLGASLYFLVAGRSPYVGMTLESQRQAHLEGEVVFPDQLPSIVQGLIARCLAKDPSCRPKSARELASQIDGVLRILTGDRRNGATVAPEWAEVSTTSECIPGLSYADRQAAGTAVLGLPLFIKTLKRLETALFANHPLVLFQGDRPLQSRIVRMMYDRRQQEVYVMSRIILLKDRDSLVDMLCERIRVVRTKTSKVYDAIVRRLAMGIGNQADMRTVLHVHVPHGLRAGDCHAIAELASRIKENQLVILVVCSPQDASAIHHEMEAIGKLSLLANVVMPKFTTRELEEYTDTWTEVATQERLLWTPDAHLLLQHNYEQREIPLDRLVHNAIVLALSNKDRLVTTWHVCGASIHKNILQSIEEVPSGWQQRPTIWPDEQTIITLQALRGSVRTAQGKLDSRSHKTETQGEEKNT